MEAEEAVEIDARRRRRRPAARSRCRPRAVVVGLAERHDHVQAVDGAALEDRDEQLRPAGGAGRAAVRARNDGAKPRLTQRERAVLSERRVGSHHGS